MTLFALVAVTVSLVLGFIGWRKLGRPITTAPVAWMIYGVYEYLMALRILCSGECNIRVDLLLIYPVLLTITIVWIVKILRSGKIKKET